MKRKNEFMGFHLKDNFVLGFLLGSALFFGLFFALENNQEQVKDYPYVETIR